MLELVARAPQPPLPRIGKRYAIVPTTREHVYELAETLRLKDRAEIAGMGHGAKKSLWRGMRNSLMCRTALVDGEVAAIWGLAVNFRQGVSLLSDTGTPWLLTSPAIERLPVAFIREGKREVEAMLRIKSRLESHVAADYIEAVRLLKILGFTLDDEIVMGLNGVRFQRFWMERKP